MDLFMGNKPFLEGRVNSFDPKISPNFLTFSLNYRRICHLNLFPRYITYLPIGDVLRVMMHNINK